MQNIPRTFLILIFAVLMPVFYMEQVHPKVAKSIFYKLQHEARFSRFEELIRHNKKARFTLFNEELTAFLPTNVAFATHSISVHSDLVFYHMTFKMRTLSDLHYLGSLNSTDPRFPPLWISKNNNEIFINNAKIIISESDYVTGSRGITAWNQQVLHVVDEVLDPFITQPEFCYDAYDLLSNFDHWHSSSTIINFFHKVKDNKAEHLYRDNGGHTFFIPVDNGIEPYKFKMINQYVIYGHVVPNYVLFTRPTMKEFNFESKANDDYVYIVLAIVERDGKMFVRGNTIAGNDENRRGEFYSEIVHANIPVKNGVVHLISQPLGIFNRTLKPFPYLPIIEKLSNDPNLDVMYELGEKTRFNKMFDRQNVTFTYFVPGETAWRNMRKNDLEIEGDELDFLRRHLVVSESPYSIDRLLALSRANKNMDIELETVAGTLRVTFIKMNDEYYIKWYNKYIKILRTDYECSNGIVHVLAGPIANLKKKGVSTERNSIGHE